MAVDEYRVTEWWGEPDWKNGSQTIWYYGFCMDCGASVEVEYQYDGTTEVDVDV